MITCFPPMIGYGVLLVLSGFIFGLPFGFLVNFIGGLLGSSCCFAVSRRLGMRHGNVFATRTRQSFTLIESPDDDYVEISRDNREAITMNPLQPSRSISIHQTNSGHSSPFHRTPSSNPSSPHNSQEIPVMPEESTKEKYLRLLRSMAEYLERNPSETIKLLLMIRFAPYPFTFVNALLAQIYSIKYWQFALATAVSLLKTVVHAWIGSTASDIQDIINKPKSPDDSSGPSASQIAEWIMLSLAIVISILGGIYIYRLTLKILNDANAGAWNKI